MLNKEYSQKIIDKVEPLIKKGIAVLDLDKNILAKSEDFFENYNGKYDADNFDKKKLNISAKGISIMKGIEKIGYLYIEEKPEKVKEMKKVLKPMIELYLGQLDILEKIPTEERFLDKFIYDLLSGNAKEETIKDQARIFDIDLSIPRVAIAIIVNGDNKSTLENSGITGEEKNNLISRIKKNISMAVDSFYTNHKKNIIGYMGDNVFVVLKDIGEENNIDENVEHFKKTINSLHYVIKNEIRSNISVGVGKFNPEIAGLSNSYGEALLAAHLGEDLWGGDAIYHFDNFGVIAPLIVGVSDRSGRFSKNLFSKFHNKEEVLKTLNTFFDTNMSLTETADKLKIHRNTLVYRLDKINEILALDPRVFDDAVQIKLAMLFSNFQVGELL